jgi:hypothetical protein
LISRRRWLRDIGLALGASATSTGGVAAKSAGAQERKNPEIANAPLELVDFQPKSMLRVPETRIEKARFPAIDIHTHISVAARSSNGVELTPERQYLGTAEELLAVMNRKNLRAMVNLTGGYDTGLADTVKKYDKAHSGRFYTFAEPSYSKFLEPNYPKLQADAIAQAHRDGARGLKILKTLGLYLRENITSGKLVKIDDPRFDPMWDACGQLNMPVAIHVSDPIAFFTPTDRFNERYEELNNHPDWSFYGGDFPSNAELLEARNRVFAHHPRTQFVVLHVGNFAEDLANVAENLDRFPNMTVDIAARIGELGGNRAPRANFSTGIRTAYSSGPTRLRMGTSSRSRYLTTSCTKFIFGFSKPATSISTTLRPKFRHKGDGEFTGSSCPRAFCIRFITRTQRGFFRLRYEARPFSDLLPAGACHGASAGLAGNVDTAHVRGS